MTQLSSIQSVPFSSIVVSRATAPATLTNATGAAAFTNASVNYVELKNIRDIPTFGASANIVKVPQYGSARTYSIGAQGDAFDFTVKVNYDPSLWVPAGATFTTTGNLADAVGDGVTKVIMLCMANKTPANFGCNGTTGNIGGSLASPTLNTLFFVLGRIESIVVTPARDDAVQADIQFSIQSDLAGPHTITAST